MKVRTWLGQPVFLIDLRQPYGQSLVFLAKRLICAGSPGSKRRTAGGAHSESSAALKQRGWRVQNLTTSFLRSRFPRMKPPRRHHKAFDREDFVFGGYKDVFLLQDSWIGHQSSLSSCIQSLHGLFKVNSKFMLRRLDRQTGRSMLVSGLKAEAYVKEVLCNVIIAPRSKKRLPFR